MYQLFICSVDLLNLLYSSASIGVSDLFVLYFLYECCSCQSVFVSTCAYICEAALHELFLQRCCDVCVSMLLLIVTGEWRKLHNGKLKFVLFSRYCQDKMRGREQYLSTGSVVILRWILIEIESVNSTNILGIFLTV